MKCDCSTESPRCLYTVVWQQSIQQWRRLSAEEQRHVWWSLIPLRVGESMAFEREPVDCERLKKLHRAEAPPVTSKPPAES